MGLGTGKKRGARRGLTFKVLVVVPFCIALAIQGIMCVAVLARSETLEQMETDAYDLFSERVSSRAGYLENDMIFRWSDFDVVVEHVGDDIDAALAAHGASAADIVTGSDLSLAVIDASADDLLSFARRAEVDGAYLVLTDGTTASSAEGEGHPALYIRDANPKVDVANGSDLQLAACPISVARRLDIALDSQWSATFPLAAEGEGQSAFYYRPLRAAQQYPDADTSDLGYWGRPVDLGWTGTQSVTYSKPVRDAAGNVVGVLGVEVRLDRIASFFPYLDLNEEGNGSYLLAVTGEEGGFARDGGAAPAAGQPRVYEVLTATGASQSLYVEDGSFESFLDDKGRMTVEPSEAASSDALAAASASEIKLYDSTSPFASEHWVLVGLEREDELFSAVHLLSENLLKVFVASIVVGIVVAVLTAWLSSSRLRHLMGEVRAASPEQPISFTPTGIVEVDELSESIEMLGSEVASAASRLSQILKLSDRSIAAFECNLASSTATYTDGFFDAMGLVLPPGTGEQGAAREGSLGGALPLAAFEQLFQSLRPRYEQEPDGRWIVSDADGRRWVRIVTVESDDRTRVFGLVEDVTDEIATRRRIEHERDHDVLTGLLNRRAFEQAVTERLADDPPAFGVMLMLDLDNLKYINDTYGHDWGDHYIKAAASVIERTFEGEGFFARISGDEFLVFVDRCADADGAYRLFDAFMRALDTSVLEAPDATVLKVRASVGVAFYPEDAVDFSHLREYADFAMYEAKNHRKGALLRFDPKSHERGAFILNNKEDLNRLLDENLIDYHFQPIVDARMGEAVAYEALMRPQLPSIATPDRVLLLARSQSKLYRVEHLTFFGALEAFAKHGDAARGATLFVNSIATQRLSSDDEVELQKRFGPLLKHLVIEITESDYSREMSLYKEGLARRWGARLAIDDFGSGYNGETSLLDYHADFVKLDMGIVSGIDVARDHQDIARNLIGYAHDRGIRVIAEGVETPSELKAVIGLGVDYLQGYLIGKPAATPPAVPADIQELIRTLAGTSC